MTNAKSKILIVDDEKNIVLFLRELLLSTGRYEVETAFSGRDGFEKAHTFLPDLILLDVMMPDFGGDQFADEAKSDPKLCNTPIIFLTGIVTKEEISPSHQAAGGYAYLAKPVTHLEELTTCIEKQLHPQA